MARERRNKFWDLAPHQNPAPSMGQVNRGRGRLIRRVVTIHCSFLSLPKRVCFPVLRKNTGKKLTKNGKLPQKKSSVGAPSDKANDPVRWRFFCAQRFPHRLCASFYIFFRLLIQKPLIFYQLRKALGLKILVPMGDRVSTIPKKLL